MRGSLFFYTYSGILVFPIGACVKFTLHSRTHVYYASRNNALHSDLLHTDGSSE